MSKTVDFIFDFASPNAYLVHKIVPEIEARTGARFHYIPCLLGGIFKATGNQAPMIAFGGIKNKPEYDALEMQRFRVIKFKPLLPHRIDHGVDIFHQIAIALGDQRAAHQHERYG